ncbi:MAG TPA: YfhO family protein [Saprospiraceae bacterium]|nr:YfhO family protein [Saprospiraceae bacterium]HMQ85363.1 YfhO family protein [Saprospiraceae bacterium]
MNSLIQKATPHALALVVFLVACAAYFYPQLQGKVPDQSDINQYRGMSQEVRKFKEETGKTSLWTNAMFGGMPTYQINTVSEGNNLKILDRLGTLGIKAPIGRFFVAMLGFYILLALLGVNQWLAIIGALAFGLTTNNLILYEAGHETKLKAISYLPLATAGILLAFRKQYLLGGLVFAIGLGLNVMANHVQMTYYFFLTLLFFGVAQLIYSLQQKELLHFGKAALVLIVGGLLALGSTASNLWITYEYSKDTMRGEPILKPEGEPQSSSETDGLAWDYAMQWSNGTLDLFASFIPGVAGGGSQETVGANSAVVKDLKRKGANIPNEIPAPLYWGALPFTSGPIYFGAVVVFLFLMGLVLVKGPVKWWLALGTLLTLLLSMGKNLEGFNRFFFDVVPLYNKFRTPNSILSVTAFLVPALGFLAMNEVLKEKPDKAAIQKALLVGGGIAALISLFFALIGPSMFSFSNPGDARYEEAGYSIEAIMADRQSLMRRDAFRSFLLVALSAGLIWAYINEKIKSSGMLLAGIGILCLFDMWTVGKRYLNEDLFKSKSQYQANFRPRPVDEQILQDTDPNYRVYDATVNPYQSASASYFHKSVGGYHAAKLQRYQDMIDRHLSKNNYSVLNMLNTRYFIGTGPDGQPTVQRNRQALDNAWFVGSIQMVNSANEEIDALTDFNPDSVAFVHQEFQDYVKGFNPVKGGSINLTSYEPNHLTYKSTAENEQFAVFSEIWYGPDKGWQAYVDGQPVEHIRANYILRAMRIPAGNHTIEFRFEPKSFQKGKMVSQVFSSILLLGFLGFLGYRSYEWYSSPAPSKPAAPKPEKSPAAPTATARKPRKKK